MDPQGALHELGGIAQAADILAFSTRWEFDQAVKAGEIVRVGHGRYALPTAKPTKQAGARLSGVVSHLSAAQVHGLEVLHVAAQPWVTIPRNRKLRGRDGVHVGYGSTTREVTDGVTDPLRTVLDCTRRLPFTEALAVADSALRQGKIEPAELRERARQLRGTGASAARRVAGHADGRAANPLESALRAIAVHVPGLAPEPQFAIELGSFTVHPDLVDAEHRLVIEAEGWLAHGSTPERFARDLERYTTLTLAGWLVVRFGRDEIIDRGDRVAAAIEQALRLRIVAADGRAVLPTGAGTIAS
jgi:hypothetical protein